MGALNFHLAVGDKSQPVEVCGSGLDRIQSRIRTDLVGFWIGLDRIWSRIFTLGSDWIFVELLSDRTELLAFFSDLIGLCVSNLSSKDFLCVVGLYELLT